MTEEPITGILLCGGSSSRMGTDKANLTLDGISFLDIALSKLDSLCSDVIVSGREVPGRRCVQDVVCGLGPLGGLHSALLACNTKWALAISCDMPQFEISIAEELANHITEDVQAIVPVTCVQQVQPLCALYRMDALDCIDGCLSSGKRSMKALLDTLKVTYVNFLDSRPFLNVNTPEDYRSIN